MDLTSQLSEQKRKVDFNTYDISVKELISMVSDNIIDIAPDYQRQFRWNTERQSELVESIFLGIPVPSLYMAANGDGTWELIDGVQRLSSIISFAGSKEARDKTTLSSVLTLSELTKLTTFNDKKFEQLPKTVQLDFLLKPLKITTLSDKSDLMVRFDLFERLNTGGVALSNQEIRSCVYRGRFNDFLKRLSSDINFKKTVKLTKAQQSDATSEEFILRFFAFYYNYKFFDHSVVDFLNDFMAESTKKFDYKNAEEVFNKTFDALKGMPNGITLNRTTTPTNLFEGIAVGAALAIKTGQKLFLKNFDWIIDPELRSATIGATNTKSKVKKRIEFSRDKFLGK
ncbi:DUF262 domain-containing protein [Mucilaginibacter conchicola]|uniref:DUF262 domain-containing protein n=1 Tax=Mucilaginibacter conchicola TaxID=2303333 RepID=A0A372NT69_9SPHI|nr:DUF262 domain-containing protein [Mucilaginibacter conchicola]RFZ92164.1 DUF262 domain-containing protein [Mucilaginibacter conchicola]